MAISDDFEITYSTYKLTEKVPESAVSLDEFYLWLRMEAEQDGWRRLKPRRLFWQGWRNMRWTKYVSGKRAYTVYYVGPISWVSGSE